MAFVNKMDRDRADFEMAFSSLTAVLGIRPVLLYMPIGEKDAFKGVVDVLGNKALFFEDGGKLREGAVPGDMAADVDSLRETMIENIAESDETLMEKYLEEGELSPEEISQGLRSGVLSGGLVPVACGSPWRTRAQLHPGHRAGAVPQRWTRGLAGRGRRRARSAAEAPVSAFVFKTLAEPFAGQLSVIRVLSGVLSPDSTPAQHHQGRQGARGQLLVLCGKEQKPLKGEAGPGPSWPWPS
jgi:elongation factor G